MATPPTEPSRAHDEALDAVRARLHAFIARRVESPDVADDLTQDVLLRLLVHEDGAVEHSKAWLYRVALRAIIDHYRTRRTLGRLDSDESTPPELAEDPFAEDPRAAERELAGCLRSLVDELAEPYRSAVTAVEFDGRTQNDVAQAAGLSVSGMKSRVQRGRHQLRQLLTDCCTVLTGPTGSISDFEPGVRCEESPHGGSICRPVCGCEEAAPELTSGGNPPSGAQPGEKAVQFVVFPPSNISVPSTVHASARPTRPPAPRHERGAHPSVVLM